MAQEINERERRETKLKKILELKEYIDNQTIVLKEIYLRKLENVKMQEDSETKRARKVYETMRAFEMKINQEKFTVDIHWFDGFNGNMLVDGLDIDSQNFCLVFMTFLNSLTYRIMSALQDYDSNGWCLNEFWKTRLELKIKSVEIFGYNSNK